MFVSLVGLDIGLEGLFAETANLRSRLAVEVDNAAVRVNSVNVRTRFEGWHAVMRIVATYTTPPRSCAPFLRYSQGKKIRHPETFEVADFSVVTPN